MSQNQTLANQPPAPANEKLWQDFFAVAQHLGQGQMTLAEKAQAITHLGLHYRMRELYRHLGPTFGHIVQHGPFAGLQLGESGEHMSACLARLLGLYELPLHEDIEAAIRRGYDTLINIGAGEGYYTLGMAHRLPSLQVTAADSNIEMLKTCQRLAALNGVGARVKITGPLTPAAVAALIKGRTLIICDIEGAEAELLDPVLTPALLQADLIIELHDVYRPGLSTRLRQMYDATHTTLLKGVDMAAPPLPAALAVHFENFSELDRYLLTFEGRAGPTPWGVFLRR